MKITLLCSEKNHHYLKDRKGFFIHIENNIKRDNSKEPGGRQKGDLYRQNMDTRFKKKKPTNCTIVFSVFQMGKVPSE